MTSLPRLKRLLVVGALGGGVVCVGCGSEADANVAAGGGTDGGGGVDANDPSDGGADAATSSSGDAGNTPDGGETGSGDAGSGDGNAEASTASLVCGAHGWKPAVPASGDAMMAFGPKGYLFGTDGLSWTVVENGVATTEAIPRPAGVTEMSTVTTEMAPSQRPLVTFTSDGQRWAAFFDGNAFVKTSPLGQATEAHADAQERIYARTQSGLVEITPGSGPITRAGFPFANLKAWTVAADGTVYLLRQASQSGSTIDELRSLRLRHAAAAWVDDTLVGTNNGYGFSTVGFAAAPDGSLHIAYVPLGIYFRSTDGLAWQTENIINPTLKATMVDPTSPGIDGNDPARVTGNIRLVAAQDYDHASVTLAYNGGSLSRPSYYFLRRCPPLTPTSGWPADRLILSSGAAFAPTPVAVNQAGMPSIATFYGVRQDTP